MIFTLKIIDRKQEKYEAIELEKSDIGEYHTQRALGTRKKHREASTAVRCARNAKQGAALHNLTSAREARDLSAVNIKVEFRIT